MSDQIDRWIALLRDADPAWAFPLIVLGLVFMLMGWRIQKVAVPFTAFLIGIIAGQVLIESLGTGLIIGGVIGLVLAGAASFTIRYSTGVLGGLVGAFILLGYLATLRTVRLPEVIHWCIALFGFAGGTALAFIMYREMGIIITSFVGSLLLVSGLNGVLPQYVPSLYQTISTFLRDYPAFFVPFVIGGPTLIGTLSQLATADKEDAGAM